MQDWGTRDPRWRGVRSEVLEVAGGDHGHEPTEVHLLRAGDDGPGTPRLLVHGLGGAAGNWLEVMAALAEDGPVVAVDLPGFGRTRPPSPRAARLRPQVRFLGRLLDQLGWSRAIVHGNSMGGLLSVLLAAAHPARVERLVLTSPALPPPRTSPVASSAAAARFAPFLSWRLGALLLERTYARTSTEELRRTTLELVMGDADDLRPAVQQVQRDNLELARAEPWRVRSFARAAADLVRTLALRRGVHDAIERVRAPTLLTWGDRDQLVGAATLRAVLARRPDWTRVDLAGVGHVPMLEAPDRWLETVRRWEADLPRPEVPSAQ